MASRFLSSRAFASAALKPTFARQQIVPQLASISALQAQLRVQSTAAQRTDPKVAAQNIISIFPGGSLAAKSSSILVTASIAAYLVSKEIYIVDFEFFEMLCLFGAYYVWYSNGKEGALAYFEGKKQTIKNVLTQARANHKAVVQERMTHIGKLSDAVEVTQGLFEISKDIAKLEAEAYELKQKANVRDQEQKRLATHVIEKIKADLADPKLQQTILQQTIADVEKLVASR
ncbi:hypothetical protein BC831DRAFT_508943 [Entophlyctis helioformis]|nr:hypothetical protein BC831DRAFT_508943 [Entophlyctis helioformis]